MDELQRGGWRRKPSHSFLAERQGRESLIHAVAQSQGCHDSQHESLMAIAKCSRSYQQVALHGANAYLQVPRYPLATQLKGPQRCGSKGPPN